jgi:hypothetical protein
MIEESSRATHATENEDLEHREHEGGTELHGGLFLNHCVTP